jgi:hypothetical protein
MNEFWAFEHSDFGFVSDFGIRISDFRPTERFDFIKFPS